MGKNRWRARVTDNRCNLKQRCLHQERLPLKDNMRSLTRILASLSIYPGDKIQRNSKLRNVRENLRNFYVHYKLLLHIISLLHTLVINDYFALAAAELSLRHINAKYNFKILRLIKKPFSEYFNQLFIIISTVYPQGCLPSLQVMLRILFKLQIPKLPYQIQTYGIGYKTVPIILKYNELSIFFAQLSHKNFLPVL